MTETTRIANLILGVDKGTYAWERIDVARIVAAQVGASFGAFHATIGHLPDELSQRAAAAAVPLGSAVTYSGADGVARALVDRRDSLDDAVIALTSHARRGLTSSLLGSVASAVLQLTTDAVLLFGPDHEDHGEITRVLACVDGSELSESILPEACRWARAAGVPLWVVQVIETDVAAAAGGGADVSYLHNVVEDLDTDGVDISFDDLHGDDPGDAIVQYANLEPGTLTALATHGRTGFRSVVMGSVATKVTRNATGPTLVRRPE